ncbi:MAG: dihydrofolate reductase [Bacteroidetes bacterium]|nr:dihydrofolate reductase [Bacteroidota bacterium]
MENRNMVFIAKSLDGYISDKNGGVDWLYSIPNPDNIDMGYSKFSEQIDAIVMGRLTFETVCGFDIEWPYKVPVFVLSRTLESIPTDYKDNAELTKGSLSEVLAIIHTKGHLRLYIDGGSTIQSFLKEDLIDDMTITTMPILLGGGAPLFSELPKELKFEHVASEVYLNEIVQDHYKRKRT